MGLNSVTVTRLQGGLGRRATNLDGVIGVITSGVAVSSTFVLGTIYPLKSIKDLEALGVDAAYDTTNATLIHHHISRIFFHNPNAEVHLMALAQTTTLAAMVDVANVSNAKKLLKDKNGRIKLLGVIRNPASGYTPTLSGGLDDDVIAAIPKAQALVEEEAGEYRYCSVIVEGRSYNGTAAAATDLRTLEAPGVSVVIGADKDVSGSNALYNGYAAVGDYLGMLSKAAVSQSPAEVIDDFDLQDTANSYWLNPGLSSNALISAQTKSTLDTLNDKGYIFAIPQAGLTGIWFNDTHTCEAIDNDYAYIEGNRTVDKAIQLARVKTLPRLNSRLLIDEETGQLTDAARTGIEENAKAAIEPMKTDGDISGGIDCFIDPEQNLLAGDALAMELTFTPVAIGRQIQISVGFNNPFN
ncbi:MAG: hypothetical protein F9K23_00705 [Bacteroidetes bacterium]|nr:MAG: hypothetical protein F9K23_00705 [Bacteroidota bacterium]